MLLIHTLRYVNRVESLRHVVGPIELDDGDTAISAGSWKAALRCVGAACADVDDVVEGRAANVFCATRPGGHHAEAHRASGFCIFNHAAIAAIHAQRAHGLQRVAVVDFDVCHGNGTHNALYRSPDLFYGSCHQAPLFAGTGARDESDVAGNIVNVPLPRGCGSQHFRESMSADLLPALRRFAPELLIVSAGFDAHHKDSLGGLEFGDDDYRWITCELMAAAEPNAGNRLVSVLEGGYSLQGLASGCVAHVQALRRG